MKHLFLLLSLLFLTSITMSLKSQNVEVLTLEQATDSVIVTQETLKKDNFMKRRWRGLIYGDVYRCFRKP